MGIEPRFNLWNHFFHDRLLLGMGVEAVVLGGMDIYIKSGQNVNPYFHLPMSESMNGWQKVWFFLKNDANVSLPMFVASHPVPQHNWGYEVARKDLHRLQTLCEVIQQLWREGLTVADLFQPPGSTTL
jgi:hypothetical protein